MTHETNRIPEGLPCGLLIYRCDENTTLLYADRNVARMYGCESFEELADFCGNRFSSLLHPEDQSLAALCSGFVFPL